MILIVVAALPAIHLLKTRISEAGVPEITGRPLSSTTLWFQLSLVLLSLIVFGIALLLKGGGRERHHFFRVGMIAAPVKPACAIRIAFLLIITAVTALLMFFQVVEGEAQVYMSGRVILFALLFSVTNSFGEEMIFRTSLVSVLDGRLPGSSVSLISGVIFGIAHYWGHPGGVPGVLLAGFLGWFLARSMMETRGFFWAWLIHFCQDVVIFTSLFLVTESALL